MDLPSFLWLWRIAAWSMTLSIVAYLILGLSGWLMWKIRNNSQPRPRWFRQFHRFVGTIMLGLVLLLLIIGLIGTLGEYGHLGHSVHLPACLLTVSLVCLSFWSAGQIHPSRPWARKLHLNTNIALFFAFCFVTVSGYSVVQKYLP